MLTMYTILMPKHVTAHLILSNQLLRNHPAFSTASTGDLFIMIEADDDSSRLPYHKHKLILMFAAMRSYADYLTSRDLNVQYVKIRRGSIFLAELSDIITTNGVTQLSWMMSSDKQPNDMLHKLADKNNLSKIIFENIQFLTSAADFAGWYEGRKAPVMESFYRWQRQRLQLLMDGDQPTGGQWNHDHDNRQPLPKQDITIPSITFPAMGANVGSAQQDVQRLFPDNPGEVGTFWLATDFETADEWLEKFIAERFENFGTYEDAMRAGQPFLFHSVLSPLINIGLLNPWQVVDRVIVAYQKGKAPLNSVEGFVRQIIGWREYVYGVYHHGKLESTMNYFGFTKQLEDWWYTGDIANVTLPVPVQAALKTALQYGYNHHIERLMILGNWFLLNEYDPVSVLKWFSSMYVDAYEWVMLPNVTGMSQYADGGTFATKPYISGANYLQNMGSWWTSMPAAKASGWNQLYWNFLYNQHDKLKNNRRMSIALKQAQIYGNKN